MAAAAAAMSRHVGGSSDRRSVMANGVAEHGGGKWRRKPRDSGGGSALAIA